MRHFADGDFETTIVRDVALGNYQRGTKLFFES
jgi:hypothetical protein